MNLKNYIIEKTQKEGFLFESVDKLQFILKKQIIKIKNGHIFRKKRIKSYLKNNVNRKLQLGCGRDNLEGFLNTDVLGTIPIDITKKLPIKDNTFDLIYSCHVIEHIYRKQFINFLKESYRILRKGGIHIIQTPSLEKICVNLYCENNGHGKKILFDDHYEKGCSLLKKIVPSDYVNNLVHMLFGHKYLYDFSQIKYLSELFGYNNAIKHENNLDLSDEILNAHLKMKKEAWDIQTETFILQK